MIDSRIEAPTKTPMRPDEPLGRQVAPTSVVDPRDNLESLGEDRSFPTHRTQCAHEMRSVVTVIECPRLSVFFRSVLAYLLLRQRARKSPGLLDLAFLARPPKAIVMLSFWETPAAARRFNGQTASHIKAVTWLYRTNAKVWSATFRVDRTAYMSRASLWTANGIREFHPS